jgi:hypothetical protein
VQSTPEVEGPKAQDQIVACLFIYLSLIAELGKQRLDFYFFPK